MATATAATALGTTSTPTAQRSTLSASDFAIDGFEIDSVFNSDSDQDGGDVEDDVGEGGGGVGGGIGRIGVGVDVGGGGVGDGSGNQLGPAAPVPGPSYAAQSGVDDDDDAAANTVDDALLAVDAAESSGGAVHSATQRFWAGQADLHPSDRRVDPPSSLERLCVHLDNADLVKLARLNRHSNEPASRRIYRRIEVNAANHARVSHTLAIKPHLASFCKHLRLWHDSAFTASGAPESGTHRQPSLRWEVLQGILDAVERRAEADDLVFEVYLGTSALKPLVEALQGPQGNDDSEVSSGGGGGDRPRCPRLIDRLTHVTIMSNIDPNRGMKRYKDGWSALKELLVLLAQDQVLSNVQDFTVLAHDDWAVRATEQNRTPPFLWHAFGGQDSWAYAWPALRRLSLTIQDVKHFNLLGIIDVPSLTSLAIDAQTVYEQETAWSLDGLDELLNRSARIEALAILLHLGRRYTGSLLTSRHPSLKHLRLHGPDALLRKFDNFVGRHASTLVTLDPATYLRGLASLQAQPFPHLRLLDARHVADSSTLVIPPLPLAHIAIDYEAIRPKPFRSARGRGNGPAVRPSGATTPGRLRKNIEGQFANANAVLDASKLLESEVPPALAIPTLQTLTSLELVFDPYKLPEVTMELSTAVGSRIFPHLLELKLVGERPVQDRTPLYLKKTPLQHLLLALTDALALRAFTIENCCDTLPPPEFLGRLLPFGPALELVLVRTCGNLARAWRITRDVPLSAGSTQVAGLGGSAGREHAINRPVVDVGVVPVDDFPFSALTNTLPADTWRELTFFPHWDDAERARILTATKQVAMIGVVPGAETHPVSSAKVGRSETTSPRLSVSGSASQSHSPTKAARGSSQRSAAARSSEQTARMLAYSLSGAPAPDLGYGSSAHGQGQGPARATRAKQHRELLERAYATSTPRRPSAVVSPGMGTGMVKAAPEETDESGSGSGSGAGSRASSSAEGGGAGTGKGKGKGKDVGAVASVIGRRVKGEDENGAYEDDDDGIGMELDGPDDEYMDEDDEDGEEDDEDGRMRKAAYSTSGKQTAAIPTPLALPQTPAGAGAAVEAGASTAPKTFQAAPTRFGPLSKQRESTREDQDRRSKGSSGSDAVVGSGAAGGSSTSGPMVGIEMEVEDGRANGQGAGATVAGTGKAHANGSSSSFSASQPVAGPSTSRAPATITATPTGARPTSLPNSQTRPRPRPWSSSQRTPSQRTRDIYDEDEEQEANGIDAHDETENESESGSSYDEATGTWRSRRSLLRRRPVKRARRSGGTNGFVIPRLADEDEEEEEGGEARGVDRSAGRDAELHASPSTSRGAAKANATPSRPGAALTSASASASTPSSTSKLPPSRTTARATPSQSQHRTKQEEEERDLAHEEAAMAEARAEMRAAREALRASRSMRLSQGSTSGGGGASHSQSLSQSQRAGARSDAGPAAVSVSPSTSTSTSSSSAAAATAGRKDLSDLYGERGESKSALGGVGTATATAAGTGSTGGASATANHRPSASSSSSGAYRPASYGPSRSAAGASAATPAPRGGRGSGTAPAPPSSSITPATSTPTTAAGGFRPGLGKSFEVASRVHLDIVDLTSSPEPEDLRAAGAAAEGVVAGSVGANGGRGRHRRAGGYEDSHGAEGEDESDGFEIL